MIYAKRNIEAGVEKIVKVMLITYYVQYPVYLEVVERYVEDQFNLCPAKAAFSSFIVVISTKYLTYMYTCRCLRTKIREWTTCSRMWTRKYRKTSLYMMYLYCSSPRRASRIGRTGRYPNRSNPTVMNLIF